MALPSWRRLDGHPDKSKPKVRAKAAVPWKGLLLRCEALEDRTVPSTFTVSNLHDGGNGSLRAAITSANATSGATIGFTPGLHGTIALTTGELDITSTTTINGSGANQIAVSGNNASRVLEIAAGQTVTIKGLTIADGFAPDEGGGILNDGSTLTLAADTLTDNVAYETTGTGGRGGAIGNLAGNLTVQNSRITGNKALGASDPTLYGYGAGGGIFAFAGNITISGNTFSANLAQGGANSISGAGFGGAVQTEESAPSVIANCVFSDNRAVGGANASSTTASGGAFSLAAPSTITDTVFDGNVAQGGNGGTGPFVGEAEAGAIAIFGPNGAGAPGTVAVSGCDFSDNLALAGNGGNSGPGQADPGVDESYGAGIFNFGGVINVTGTNFSDNRSVGGNGGTATGSDIVEVGVAEGGAICSEIGATATFSGCNFDGNQAIGGNGNTGTGPVVHAGSGFGAGIFSGFGGTGVGANALIVTGGSFIHNTSQGGNDNTGNAGVAGLIGAGVGGAIMNGLGGAAAITASAMVSNQAIAGHGNTAGGGGVVFLGGAGGGLANYLGNYNSTGYGGFGPSTVSVSNTLISGNQAVSQGGTGEGGGIADMVSATTTVGSSILTLNEAQGTHGGSGLGGGAFNDATSSLSLADSLVILNLADGTTGIGGGIYTVGTFSDTHTLILGNHATTSGNDVGP